MSPHAPYLNKLAARGTSLAQSYGVTHPSQPTYLALFSGSTHGIARNARKAGQSWVNDASTFYVWVGGDSTAELFTTFDVTEASCRHDTSCSGR
jgi:arylsulfatase A-like enzyme